MSDWKWHEVCEKESTVIPSVRAVAVYTNPAGCIVIRQEGDGYGDQPEDAVIVLPRTAIPALLKALRAEAAKPFDPTDPSN